MDASEPRWNGRRDLVGVAAWVGLLLAYVWIALPRTGGDPRWGWVFTTSAFALAVLLVWLRRAPRERIGLRLDNLAPSLALYLVAAGAWTGLTLLLLRGSLDASGLEWPRPGGTAWLLTWAFLQEFCLLAFILDGLRCALGRPLPAVIASAAIFSLLHLPNPFLTLYTLGGGLVLGALFVYRPSLPAATVAHATASWLATALLDERITGRMKVGPLYWW